MLNYFRTMLAVLTYPLRAMLEAPATFVRGSRRLAGMSLPAQVAILTFFVLILSEIISVIVFCNTPNKSGNWSKLTPGFWITTTVLVFVIPLVLYKVLTLWLEGPRSRYPEIDHAWRAGLRELQRKGLNIRQIPMFLVIGSTSEAQERSIFMSPGMDFLVTGAPEGDFWLHWYANTEAIYVIASQTCCLSSLSRGGAGAASYSPPAAPAPAAPASPGGHGNIRETVPMGGARPMAADPAEARPASRPEEPAPPAPVARSAALRGTIVGPSASAPSPAPGAAIAERNISNDKKVLDEQKKRFRWLCRLIRRSRLPFVPINGVLALMPFGYVSSVQPGIKQVLANALRLDLEEVLSSLMIRCPVTVLLTDLDEDAGFREFVRRMVRREGQDWVRDRRFGSSFPVDIEVTQDRIQRLSALLGASFEHWVYDFFRDQESVLRAAGNTSLYTFLSKVRQSVRNLVAIFGSFQNLQPKTSGKGPTTDIVFFAGCYFAGTGKTDDRQVFIKKVLEKPIEQQEDLEWTAAAIQEDNRYQWLGLLASAFDTVLLFGGGVWWLWYVRLIPWFH